MSRAPATRPADPSPTPAHDPIAPWCADTLALFAGALADVRFPDVDAASLAAGAAEVRRAQVEIEALERALDDARVAMQATHAGFVDRCHRALAYARVFATAQPEHEAAVTAVCAPLARPAAESTPRRRGRPPKDRATVELLPDDAIAAQ